MVIVDQGGHQRPRVLVSGNRFHEASDSSYVCARFADTLAPSALDKPVQILHCSILIRWHTSCLSKRQGYALLSPVTHG